MPYPYNIERINKRAMADPKGFASECEAIFNRKVAEVAATVAEMTSATGTHVVLLSGPSGSGKTTTAKKICEFLETLGIRAHSVSLDKYYVRLTPESAPRTDDGEIDRESPYCLDLELLNKHFHMLERGEEIVIPHFSFKLQERDPAKEKTLKPGRDELVVFEGIHALNDLLTDEHPNAFKLYISARSDIMRGSNPFFKRTWTRLLRRVVRDALFRATGAAETLKMWAIVRDGEKKYISPFKYKADLLYDSSLEYEVPLMKHYALKALREVPNDIERREELLGLLPALMEFEEIDAAYVPPDSVLREFIGGGTYKY